MLRRHDVDGGVGYVLEYYGPGLETLSAMDRHVIANMGTELGGHFNRVSFRPRSATLSSRVKTAWTSGKKSLPIPLRNTIATKKSI